LNFTQNTSMSTSIPASGVFVTASFSETADQSAIDFFYNDGGTWTVQDITLYLYDVNGNGDVDLFGFYAPHSLDYREYKISADLEGSAGSPAGGGGTTIILDAEKRLCDIVLVPNSLDLFSAGVSEVVIVNDDSQSYSPDFIIEGTLAEYLEITNPVSTILAGKKESFGLSFAPTDDNITGTATVTLSSQNCEDVKLEVSVGVGIQVLSVFEKFFDGRISFTELLKTSVFNLNSPLAKSANWASIGLLALVLLVFWSSLFWKLIRETLKEQEYLVTTLWVLFIVFATSLSVVFIVAILKALT